MLHRLFLIQIQTELVLYLRESWWKRERDREREGEGGYKEGRERGRESEWGEEVRGVCGVGGERERKVKREEKGREEGESRRRGNG